MLVAERKMETTRLSCTVGHVIDMVEGKVLVSRGGYGVQRIPRRAKHENLQGY